jgi:hypothetical protein
MADPEPSPDDLQEAHQQALRRRRTATLGGYGRITRSDPDELQAARRRGGETRARQLRGDSSWGRRMAEQRLLKAESTGRTPPLTARMCELEARLFIVEEALGLVSTRHNTGGSGGRVQVQAASATEVNR